MGSTASRRLNYLTRGERLNQRHEAVFMINGTETKIYSQNIGQMKQLGYFCDNEHMSELYTSITM